MQVTANTRPVTVCPLLRGAQLFRSAYRVVPTRPEGCSRKYGHVPSEWSLECSNPLLEHCSKDRSLRCLNVIQGLRGFAAMSMLPVAIRFVRVGGLH